MFLPVLFHEHCGCGCRTALKSTLFFYKLVRVCNEPVIRVHRNPTAPLYIGLRAQYGRVHVHIMRISNHVPNDTLAPYQKSQLDGSNQLCLLLNTLISNRTFDKSLPSNNPVKRSIQEQF